MELGTGDEKIVSGKGLEDTYIKMLTSIKGLTDPVAKGIVREYPTLRCLYEAWNRCTSEKERQTMLVGIMVRPIHLVPRCEGADDVVGREEGQQCQWRSD